MDVFRCFKYRSVNKNLIDSLVNSTLYFAPRNKLNDPFDSQIDLKNIIITLLDSDIDDESAAAIEVLEENGWFFDKFEDGLKDFGICSFSVDLENTLMWSHYGDEHKGLALCYEIPASYMDNPDEIVGVAPVIYESNPISEWILMNADQFENDHYTFVTELLKKVITVKSPAWEYEKEGRVIRFSHGAYEIPREFLKEIVFGMRITESDQALILNIANTYYKDIKFSKVMRSGCDFGIEIVDVE